MKEPIKPNEVSLYNHAKIGTDDRPLISNADYRELYNKISSGDHEALKTAQNNFTIEPKQLKVLTDIINNRII